MLLINKCIIDLELFCNNKLQSMVGMDNQYGEVQLARQRMLKEQQFFEALAQILKFSLQADSEKELVKSLKGQNNMYIDYELLKEDSPELITLKSYENDVEMMRVKLISNVVENTYKLITILCHKNRENQLYAYQFFNIFINHVGLNVGATKCMLAILKDNEKLLLEIHEPSSKSKNDNIISFYTDLLKHYHSVKKPQLIEFLRTICVYKGDSVAVNQEKVYDYIFTNPEIHEKALIPVSAQGSELYLSLGEHKKEIVSVESCFLEGKITHHTTDMIYFTKLLELFANLCLGRNYMCTEALRDHFPAEILQAMMWNQGISKHIRAAFCKLMLTIHVDTFPKEEFHKPELIKVLILKGWPDSEIVRHNTRFLSEDAKTVNVAPKSIHKTKKSLFNQIGKAAGKVLKLKTSTVIPQEDEIIRFLEDEKLNKQLLIQILFFFSDMSEFPSYDVLTYEILRMSDKMVKFELYGAVCTDFENGYVIKDPTSAAFSTKNMDIVKFLSAVSKIYFKNHQTTSEKSKFSSIRRRASRFSKGDVEDEDSAPKKPAKSSFLTSLLNDPTSLSDPIIRCAANLRNFLHLLRQTALQNPNQKNYENRIKVRICRMMHYYLD